MTLLSTESANASGSEFLVHGNRILIFHAIHGVQSCDELGVFFQRGAPTRQKLEARRRPVLRLDNLLPRRNGPRIVEAANNAMVEGEMRQRLKALKIAALRQNHIVEIRGFVKEDINTDDIFIALENLGLLIVVSPPLNRVCMRSRTPPAAWVW